MKARKLPSGRWRVRTCIGGERKSFTADTRQEAEFMAHAYVVGKRREPSALTVGQAIRAYIDDRAAVLSPSTLCGYNSLARNAYEDIARVRVDDLNNAVVQRWVASYASTHAPKRTANAYGLLKASVTHFNPDIRISARLPQKTRTDAHTPSAEEVTRLLEYIRGRERDLYVAVLLGAFVPMRRGEVCGLRGADIDHKAGTVTVRHNLVVGDGNVVFEKAPKTQAGYRTVSLPRSVMAELSLVGKDDHVVSLSPQKVSQHFKSACRACGMPEVHFHSLRHFGASYLHALGIPDAYVMSRGGWQTADVMRRVYREALDDQARRMSEQVNAQIDMLMP